MTRAIELGLVNPLPKQFTRIPTTELTDHKIEKYVKEGRYGSKCEACGRLAGSVHVTVRGKVYHYRCAPKRQLQSI